MTIEHTAFLDRYGPVAVVTGASSGIGEAFAAALAARGFDLVLVARRIDRLEALAARLSSTYGIKAQVLELDLAAPSAAQAILDATRDQDVGLVVSNAGFGLKGAHERNDASAMAEMLMVNCNVPMLLSHGFIPRLQARERGGIIFTSSIEALLGLPYSGAYSATKALVSALGDALWGELNPQGIDVLTLCPGPTRSEAAAKQGVDISKLAGLMEAEDVAEATLDHLRDGPAFFSNEPYRANMEKLLALPRATALTMMASTMKQNTA